MGLRLLISKDEIAQKVAQLAAEIKRDYQDQTPLLLGVLKGGFVFMADLVRSLNMPLEVEFVRLSSYGAATTSSGKIKVMQGLTTQVRGRHLLVVDDVVDTGLTLSFFLGYLRRRKPASLKVCALFDKPSRRIVELPIDYLGFTLEDVFVVGYGLDYNERFRYLPDLCIIEEAEMSLEDFAQRRDKMNLADKIRDIPDFPQKGVVFKDITTLLKDGGAFRQVVNDLSARYRDKGIEVVVAIEARGYIIAAPVAYNLGVAFVPVRKPGKLPAESISMEYSLEYGKDSLEIHKDAIQPGSKVLVVDDLLATGGTLEATIKLVEKLGGEVVSAACLIELTFLKGRERLKGYDIQSLIRY